MNRAFRRLRHLSFDELSWRARGLSRIAAQRVAASVRAPRWNRKDVTRVLADSVIDRLPPDALRKSEWTAVHACLVDIIRQRPARFALDPANRAVVRDQVLARWPDAGRDASARADRIVAHRYDLLGYRDLAWAGPDGEIDWHFDPVHHRRPPVRFWASVPYLDPAIGDHKVIWELNRHQHWLQLGRAFWLTGNRRYATAIVTQLEHWLAANPPLVGINWASMLEIGLRAMSWTWALHFVIGERGSPGPQSPWLIDLLIALERQMTHVERNLSIYFSPNTHLTGEALALYVVGMAFPELEASGGWTAIGRTILLEQIDRQIHSDGGHRERSTHYHRYTLDFYLMALLTATRNGDKDAAARFADAVTRLAEFMRAMADDKGHFPLIGDDDGGMLWPIAGRRCNDARDSLSTAALLLDRPDLCPWGLQEESVWIAGPYAPVEIRRDPERPAVTARSMAFADTGYVVLRDGSGSHATFDVGCHGYLNGGHAHADALALTLTVAGRPLLIDPGTFTYTMDSRLRDHLRCTRSHNTVTLDSRSQARPAGAFHWQSRADAHLHGSRHNAGCDWAEGSHDGYSPDCHRRSILRTRDGGWLIVDELLGTGVMGCSAYWHFDPAWTLHCDGPGRLLITHADGCQAWLLHDATDLLLAHGGQSKGLGWVAPVYGTLAPAWTARTSRCAAAPVRLVTWIAVRGSRQPPPLLEPLACTSDRDGHLVGVRIVRENASSVVLLHPGEPPARVGRASGTSDYQTDARVLHYAEQHDRLTTLDLLDCSHALSMRDGWITVACDGPVSDLHLTRSRDRLELFASAPPSRVRLQGQNLADVTRVELNHREWVPLRPRCPGTLTIASTDWGAPAVDHAAVATHESASLADS